MEMMNMSYRMFSMSAVALGFLVLGTTAFAAEEPVAATHDGKVVSIAEGQLVMTAKGDKEAKEHTHAFAPEATFTLDGKACKWSDLKPGTKIRVTTQANDSKVVASVEAIVKNKLFADTHDGKVVSMTGDRLVMKDSDGKEHSHTVVKTAKLTCDGKECKAADLKSGMMIRVTTAKGDAKSVICIEALNKETEFARI